MSEQIGTRPSTNSVELIAAFLEQEILKADVGTESTDDVIERVVNMTPAALLARIAMQRTGINNPLEATKKLLEDEDVKHELLADIAEIPEGLLDIDPKTDTYTELRELARSGKIDINDLPVGPVFTLDYAKGRGRGRSHSHLVVARNAEGTDNDKASFVILDTEGKPIRESVNYVKPEIGNSLFWGYFGNDGLHHPGLLRGSNPAWVNNVTKDSNGGFHAMDNVKTNKKFTLRQVYMSRGTDFPLFED
jgi:hypothetical protein